jgi:prolyl-tRNA synthetase
MSRFTARIHGCPRACHGIQFAQMRYSRLFTKTIRQVPKDIRSPSHRLLVQGGYVRPLGQGLFSFTPLGMRVIRNLQQIMREELEELGGQEVLTPLANPRDIWESSGRDSLIEQDMVRFTDRGGRRLVLAPTHEEAMVELVRDGIRSYRDLPVLLYQFQTKFRDEARIRCGLVRSREFIMNDAYSFHRTFTDLNGFFPRMFAAYHRIFERCSVPVTAAQAGVGYMGGDRSYEFLMPSECGDDYLIYCDGCGYAASGDVAVGDCETVQETPVPMEPVRALEESGIGSMNALRQELEIPRSRMLKAMLYRTVDKAVMAIVRGDHEVSEEKLTQVIHRPILGRADEDTLRELGIAGPWLSPLDIPEHALASLLVVIDDVAAASTNMFAGSNEPGLCYRNVNFGRDFEAKHVADIIRIPESSGCCHCDDGVLRRTRAMELGNVFRLGTYYTEAMNLVVRDDHGRLVYPHMGSYGIGLGRLMAAIVDINHDDRGIIWPAEVAPFSVYLMAIGKSASVRRSAEEIYETIRPVTLFDDRFESISHKLKDADLLGIPIRVIVSRESITDGVVEVALRTGEEPQKVPLAELKATIDSILEDDYHV